MYGMQRFTRRGLILIVILSLALAVLTLIALSPQSRHNVRSLIFSNQRHILAKATGHISKDGPFVSVFKIKERDIIVVEIYTIGNGENATPRLLQKFSLDQSRDGYFNFMGSATNLALSDTDGDGYLEILAPTFDAQMTARLHVFRYSRTMGNFERVIAPSEGGTAGP